MATTRLDGMTAIVTGASGGIGRETARVLSASGANVTLAVRDQIKGDEAAQWIRDSHPDVELEIGSLDLTSLASVRKFAIGFTATHKRLDLLVNNAGVMFPPLTRTQEGFELQFGTNHLGHFALTSGLLPLLRASGRARVVNVSSAGHSMGRIDFDDPNFTLREYDKLVGYGQSKTANILFAQELDRRFSNEGIHGYSLHPGMIATDLARHMDSDDFTRLMERAKARAAAASEDGEGMPSFKTVEQGAATSVWAAITSDDVLAGGSYCSDCAIATPENWATDPEIATHLWSLSEDLVAHPFVR